MSQSLFSQPLNVINVGIAMFSDDLKKQHVEVTQLDWTPPGQGNMQVVQALDNIADSPLADKIAAANQQALERIIQSHPVLIGFDQAINVVPGMTPKTILHAGPPITWEKMCGAMKGAVTGALVFEGLAKDLDDAAELAASGEITFSPCHEHDCVGSMAGVTSASMFMHIVKNKTYGNIAYTNMSEQMAKILRMGANDQSVIDRLNWMRDVQGPILRDAMKIIGEIESITTLTAAIASGMGATVLPESAARSLCGAANGWMARISTPSMSLSLSLNMSARGSLSPQAQAVKEILLSLVSRPSLENRELQLVS